MATVEEKLALMWEHLTRVRHAESPPDWFVLATAGLHCLEAAVDAATLHFGLEMKATHKSRVAAASLMSERHGLPDVSELLDQINSVRMDEAYGDVENAPQLEAHQVTIEIERFAEAVFWAMGNQGQRDHE